MASLAPANQYIFDHAFNPASIAVVGASDQPFSFGYHFLKHLLDYKYKGSIYPVNPQKETILGVKCFPSLASVPGEVEFVICCMPAGKVLSMLDECAQKNVKIVHLFTARLSETGRPDAINLEQQILLRARQHGIRLIGPNCMGVYHPAAGIAFGYDLPVEPGKIGLAFQSGGAACLLIQQCGLLGMRFSKAVSYGNALDLDECDLLEYFMEDSSTEIIAAYFEGVKDGARLLKTLKQAAAKKPVIAIKGGRSSSGTRAAASHTASLAGTQDIWHTAFRQAGVLEVNNFDDMVNLLQLFYKLPPIYGNRAAIMGGGGGKAVLGADLAEEAGLLVPPLTDQFREKLKALAPELWDWLGNPVDVSIFGDNINALHGIPTLLAESTDNDFIIMQTSDENPMDDDLWAFIIKASMERTVVVFKQGKKPVISVLSGGKPGLEDMKNMRWQTMAEMRSLLVREGVPVYDTTPEAVAAIGKYVRYWQGRRR